MALSVPKKRTGSSGNAAHSGNCAVSSRRTSASSIGSSSACILGGATRLSRDEVAARNPKDVLPPVERVVVGPRPLGHRRPDRLVAVEGELDHAFAARQAAKLLLQLVGVRGRNVAFEDRPRSPRLRRL